MLLIYLEQCFVIHMRKIYGKFYFQVTLWEEKIFDISQGFYDQLTEQLETSRTALSVIEASDIYLRYI